MNDAIKRDIIVKLESVLKTDNPNQTEYNDRKIPTVLYDFHRSVDVLLDASSRVNTLEDFGKLPDREKADVYIAARVVEYTWTKGNDRLEADHGSMYENTSDLGVLHISNIAYEYYKQADHPIENNIHLVDNVDARIERFYQRYGAGSDATRECPDFAHCLLQDEHDERAKHPIAEETALGDKSYMIRAIPPTSECFLTSVSQDEKIQFIREYKESNSESDYATDKAQTAEFLRNHYISSADKIISDPSSSVEQIAKAKEWMGLGGASPEQLEKIDERMQQAKESFIHSANSILSAPDSNAVSLERAVNDLEKASADPEQISAAREKMRDAFTSEAGAILSQEHITGEDYERAAEYLSKGNGTPAQIENARSKAEADFTSRAESLLAKENRTIDDVESACELYEKAGMSEEQVDEVYRNALGEFVSEGREIIEDRNATSEDIGKAIELLESGNADAEEVIDARILQCDLELDELFTEHGLYDAVEDPNMLGYELNEGHDSDKIRGHIASVPDGFWEKYDANAHGMSKEELLQKINNRLDSREELCREKDETAKEKAELEKIMNGVEDKAEKTAAKPEEKPADKPEDKIEATPEAKPEEKPEVEKASTVDTPASATETPATNTKTARDEKDTEKPADKAEIINQFRDTARQEFRDLSRDNPDLSRRRGEFENAVEHLDTEAIRGILTESTAAHAVPERLENIMTTMDSQNIVYEFKAGEITADQLDEAAKDFVDLLSDPDTENKIRSELGDDAADHYRDLMVDLSTAIISGDRDKVRECENGIVDILKSVLPNDTDRGATAGNVSANNDTTRSAPDQSRNDKEILDKIKELGSLAYIDKNRNYAVRYGTKNPFLLKAQINYARYINKIDKEDYKRITHREKPQHLKIEAAILTVEYYSNLSLSNISSACSESLYQAFTKLDNLDKDNLAEKAKAKVVTTYNIDKVDKLLKDPNNDFTKEFRKELGEERFNEFKTAIENYKNTGESSYIYEANRVVEKYQDPVRGLDKKDRFDPKDAFSNLDIFARTLEARSKGQEIERTIPGMKTENGAVTRTEVFMAFVNVVSNSDLLYTLKKEMFEGIKETFFAIFQESKMDVKDMIDKATVSQVESKSEPVAKDKIFFDTYSRKNEKTQVEHFIVRESRLNESGEKITIKMTDTYKSAKGVEHKAVSLYDIDKVTTTDFYKDANGVSQFSEKYAIIQDNKETVLEEMRSKTDRRGNANIEITTHEAGKPDIVRKIMLNHEDMGAVLGLKEELVKDDPDIKKIDADYSRTERFITSEENNRIGNLYEKNGEYEKAIACWDKANGFDTEGRIDKARAAIVKEELAKDSPDLDKAKSHLDAMSDKADKTSYATLGEKYAEKGQYEQALDCYGKAGLDNTDERVEKAQAARDASIEKPENAGEVHADASGKADRDSGQNDTTGLLSFFDGLGKGIGPSMVDHQLNQAEKTIENEDLKERTSPDAIKTYKDALASVYRDAIGEKNLDGEYYDRAIAVVDKMTASGISTDSVRQTLCAVSAEIELKKDSPDLDKVKARLDAAGDEADKTSYATLGEKYAENGRYEQAIDCYEKAGLDQSEERVENAHADAGKEEIAKDSPDLDKAKEHMDASGDKADKDDYAALGEKYAEKGQHEQALDCYGKAGLDNNDERVENAHASIAKEELASESPDLDKVKENLDAAHGRQDLTSEYDKLGDMYADIGKKEHALECWTVAKEENTEKFETTSAEVEKARADIEMAKEYDRKQYDLDDEMGQPDDTNDVFINGAEALMSLDDPSGDDYAKAAEWLEYGGADSERIESAHEKACESYLKEGYAFDAYKETRGISNDDLKTKAVEAYASEALSDAKKDTGTYVRAARLFELLPEDRQKSDTAKEAFSKGARQIDRNKQASLQDIRRAIEWEKKTDHPDPDIIESLEKRESDIEKNYEAYAKEEIESAVKDIVLPALQNSAEYGDVDLDKAYSEVSETISAFTNEEYTREMFADDVRLYIEDMEASNDLNDSTVSVNQDVLESIEDSLREFAPNPYDVEIENGGGEIEVSEEFG